MSKILALVAIVAVVAVAGAGVYVLMDPPGGNVAYNYAESDDIPTMLPTPAAGTEYLIVDVTVKNIDYSDEDDGYDVDTENFNAIRGSDGKTYWFKEELTDRYNMISGFGYAEELFKGQTTSLSIVFIVPTGVSLAELDVNDHENEKVTYELDRSLPV